MQYTIKRLSVCLMLLFLTLGVRCQDGSKTGSYLKSYSRNSLSVLMVDKSGAYSSNLRAAMNGLAVPDKFDDNMLTTRFVGAMSNSQSIMQKLSSLKVPNQVLAKWFSRQADGTFNMSVVHERGLYNATDADVVEAAASKLGLAQLQDAGEMLVSRSYILVLDFTHIRTMEEVYDEMDKQRKANAKLLGIKYVPVSRTKYGYEGKVVGYMYKIDNIESAMDKFYSEMWISDDDTDEAKAAKRQAFDSEVFPLQFVASSASVVEASASRASSERMTDSQLFSLLTEKSVSALLNNFESSLDELKVRTALYDIHPIRAKIGKKEGLQVEDRYFVYEYRMDEQNNVYADRRGVVRAKKVADNRFVAQGQSSGIDRTASKFYQVAGHKLEPGMFLEQSNDSEMSFSFGYAAGGFGGIYAAADVLMGNVTGITQFKFFMNGHFDIGTHDLTSCGRYSGSDMEDASFIFFGADFGFSKGFFLTRNVSLAGQAGIGLEWADALDSDISKEKFNGGMVEAMYVFAGAQLAINVRYDIQLVGGVNTYADLGSATLTKKDKDGNETNGKDLGVSYSKLFEGRGGMSINFGVRILF